MKLFWLRLAFNDRNLIFDYIAAHNSDAAETLDQRIVYDNVRHLNSPFPIRLVQKEELTI